MPVTGRRVHFRAYFWKKKGRVWVFGLKESAGRLVCWSVGRSLRRICKSVSDGRRAHLRGLGEGEEVSGVVNFFLVL